MIFYASLVLDWSGSKLSKSIYVKGGAYKYLCKAGSRYMLDAKILAISELGLDVLIVDVYQWVVESYKIFGSYSVEYLYRELVLRGMKQANQLAETDRIC